MAKLVDGPASRNHLAKKKLLCARFLGVFATYSLVYTLIIYKSKQSDNEILRIGASGSLTFLVSELCCFPLDTINFQLKLCKKQMTSAQMVKEVYKHYGLYGIYRGFSTSYYSSTSAAFFFFIIYKGLK